MRRLLALLAALGISLVSYAGLFVFVLDKPLTVGELGAVLAFKQQRLQHLARPGIVVFAGSNGHYSHRCEAIAEVSGRDCVNMAVSVELGTRYQLDKLRGALESGDLVYLPLEYAYYASAAGERTGQDIPYYLWHDRDYLLEAGWDERLHAIFYSDLPFVFSALTEMVAVRFGAVASSPGVGSLNAWGDRVGHQDASGDIFIRNFSAYRFNIQAPADTGLDAFLAWCRAQGVRVVGGLPTTPREAPIPNDLIAGIRDYFVSRGHAFLELPNRSRYPRDRFYDSDYHLAEPWQIIHSRRVARSLMALAGDAATREF
ncbi:MAG: hypothetical protein ABFS23_09600 [Pseudomonadota bacterium]